MQPYAKKTILLVEDAVIIQKVHKKMLEGLACYVDIASSREEVLTKMDNHYDCIFMDIELAGMSGFETIEKIRASNSKIKNAPIIVLTAFASKEINVEFLATKATAVVTKPMTIKKFENILSWFA